MKGIVRQLLAAFMLVAYLSSGQISACMCSAKAAAHVLKEHGGDCCHLHHHGDEAADAGEAEPADHAPEEHGCSPDGCPCVECHTACSHAPFLLVSPVLPETLAQDGDHLVARELGQLSRVALKIFQPPKVTRL